MENADIESFLVKLAVDASPVNIYRERASRNFSNSHIRYRGNRVSD